MVLQKQGDANVGPFIVGTREEKRSGGGGIGRERERDREKKSQTCPVSRTELAIKVFDLAM